MDSRSSVAAHGAGRSGPSQRFTHAGPAALMRCGRPRADAPRVGLAAPTRIRLTRVSRGAHGLRSGRHCPDAARRSPWGTALQAACGAPAGAWPHEAPGPHSPVCAQCCARLMRRAAQPPVAWRCRSSWRHRGPSRLRSSRARLRRGGSAVVLWQRAYSWPLVRAPSILGLGLGKIGAFA